MTIDAEIDGTVNSRITDSVASVVTLMTGQAPAQAFGILDTVMAETLSMAMHNAVMRQQASSMVGAAAVTAACAKMLQSPLPLPPPPPPPAPWTPPGVQPLRPESPEGEFARAEAAISDLGVQEANAKNKLSQIEAFRAELAAQAQPTPPSPATSAPPPKSAPTPKPARKS